MISDITAVLRTRKYCWRVAAWGGSSMKKWDGLIPDLCRWIIPRVFSALNGCSLICTVETSDDCEQANKQSENMRGNPQAIIHLLQARYQWWPWACERADGRTGPALQQA